MELTNSGEAACMWSESFSYFSYFTEPGKTERSILVHSIHFTVGFYINSFACSSIEQRGLVELSHFTQEDPETQSPCWLEPSWLRLAPALLTLCRTLQS